MKENELVDVTRQSSILRAIII